MSWRPGATMVVSLILVIFVTPGLLSLTEVKPREKFPPKRSATAGEKELPPMGTVGVRILGVNDLHGNVEPPYGRGGKEVGGAAHLAAYLDHYEQEAQGGTIRVHAGDMVGGSPLVSSHFHDEPTIHAMNEMDFDVGTLGNHEFDEGAEEMLRLIEGGRRSDDEPGNTSDPLFPGAVFPYVAANTLYKSSGASVLPPFWIAERDGVRIGFIGVTTPSTQDIVMPDAVEPFRFPDISQTVNKYAGELRGRGVRTIVVLAHAGGYQSGPEKAAGEILSETAQMSDAVDVVFAGHTHNRLDARVGEKRVVQAQRYGTAISVVDLKVERATGEVTSSGAKIVPVRADSPGITPDPEVAALVEGYAKRVEPLVGRVVGTAAENMSLSATASGESQMGNFVADAQRTFAGADLAFIAPGGIRTDLKAGPVTYGELFATQPFGDRLVKMKMSGEQLYEVLEWQYVKEGSPLQVSGVRFVYDLSKPAGQRVTSAVLDDGSPLDPGATYTVAVKGFLAEGGGDQEHFTKGRNPRVVGTDIEALVEHVEGLPQPFVAPDPTEERRMRLGN